MTFVVAATVEAARIFGSTFEPPKGGTGMEAWSRSACLPPAKSCSRPCGTAVVPGGTVLCHPALARLALRMDPWSVAHCCIAAAAVAYGS
jgi:hypothetical protein